MVTTVEFMKGETFSARRMVMACPQQILSRFVQKFKVIKKECLQDGI
jgi:hypothetical protein